MRLINWVQVDIPVCGLKFADTNSEGTCNSTALSPCFNSLATCSSLPDYEPRTAKAFFTDSTIDLDMPIGDLYTGAIPIANIQSVEVTPPRIALGEGIGARSSLRVTFSDHPTSDLQSYEDLYTTERNYNPFKQGTFWGKFMARHKFLRGQVVRWAIVDPQQISFDEFPPDAQIFIIDRFEMGIGSVTMIAKDPASLLDDKRAIAPSINRGSILSDLTISGTTVTLDPPDIGDADYPASGIATIGGKEIVSFTRSGNVLTIVRAQENTEATTHTAGDRVQVCLKYDALDPSVIIHDLITNYSSIKNEYINLAEWQAQTEPIGSLYSTVIAEPTSVKDLIDDLMIQSGIAIWWNGQTFRLQPLQNISMSSHIDDDIIASDSFSIKDQPEKRVSQVWTYFGLRNPLESIDDPKNYESVQVTAQATAQELEEAYNGIPSVRTIYGRWINRFQKDTANRLNSLILSRFATPPRMVNFGLLNLPYMPNVGLGIGASVSSKLIQSASGEGETIPTQVVELRKSAGVLTVAAEEITFFEVGIEPGVKAVTVSNNTNNFNLYSAYSQIWSDPLEGDTVLCLVESGVIIGSTSTANPAFVIGTGWPDVNFTIKIAISPNAFIVGKGGAGGSASAVSSGTVGSGGIQNPGSLTAQNGGNGGTAMFIDRPIEIENDGRIGGGGGGGGGAANELIGRPLGFPGAIAISTASGGGAGAGANIASGGGATTTGYQSSRTQTKVGGDTSANTARGFGFVAKVEVNGNFPTYIESSSRGGFGGFLGGQATNALASGGKEVPDGGTIIYHNNSKIGTPGQPGVAINGDSFITFITEGVISGARIN